MTMGLSIAAVIPLYNGQAFIREALESVFSQTHPVDEIIVVDDGSTDGGARVVEDVMGDYPLAGLRLISKPNGGQSAARNFGVAHTNCDLIAFLDQDDAWYPNHIEVLRKPFEADAVKSIGLVYGNLDRTDLAGRIVHREFLHACPSRHPKVSRAQCLSEDLYILPSASIVRKSSFVTLGGFDERLCGYEDDDLFLRIFSRGLRLVFIDTAVSKWRIHAGSTSYSPRMARSQLIYFHKLAEAFPDEPGIGSYWTSEVIAPRFFREVVHHFLDGLKKEDPAQADAALESARQIVPFLPSHYRRTFNTMVPAVQVMRRLSLEGLAARWIERKLEA